MFTNVYEVVYEVLDIHFSSITDAKKVLSKMECIINEHKCVSVADFYNIVGAYCTLANCTDRKYGWTSLTNTKIRQLGQDDFVIVFPNPVKLSDVKVFID